jgi:competence protein ComEA
LHKLIILYYRGIVLVSPVSLKEKAARIKFVFEKIRYSREKNFFAAIFFVVVLIVSVASGVYFYQRREIRIKENILKSYYAETGPETLPDTAENTNTGSGDTYETVDNGSGKLSETANSKEDISIKAYICGCVLNPGVYELRKGSRLIDLLNVAGGAGKDACLEAVNLSLIINDQDMAYIPTTGEIDDNGFGVFDTVKNNSFSGTYISSTGSASGSKENPGVHEEEGSLININTASLEELQQLPGIGEKIAGAIIEHRDNFGSFSGIENIKDVKGIGEKKYESIKDMITV